LTSEPIPQSPPSIANGTLFWSCAREASEKIQVASEATIKGAMTQDGASNNHFHDNSNGRFVMFRETIIFTGTILA
jgi:hypothetical protein